MSDQMVDPPDASELPADQDATPQSADQDSIDPEELIVPPWAARIDKDHSQIIPLSLAKSPAEELARRADVAEPPRSGIIVVDKPAGRTSFDVVKSVRKAADERRVGHAGTLDPMATGVLVVCLGSATRVIEHIQDGKKRYVARITFGQSTDTYDAEGEVVEERDPSGLERADVEAALEAFRGDILQVPPMYSALKKDGKRLYELAREGIEIDRPARPVSVYSLHVADWSPPDLSIELEVSKGTYIRSIAHDLGQALGVGAHLSALRRTAVGHFDLRQAERLSKVVEAFVEGWWPLLTYPLDAALTDHAAIVLDADGTADMRHGRQFEAPAPDDLNALVRVYDDRGSFVGLARWDSVHLRWQPDRVFPAPATERGSGKKG